MSGYFNLLAIQINTKTFHGTDLFLKAFSTCNTTNVLLHFFNALYSDAYIPKNLK
jgi:hypothetical protein